MTEKAKEAEAEAEDEEEEHNCCKELREEFRLHRLGLEHPQPAHFVSPQVRRNQICTLLLKISKGWFCRHHMMTTEPTLPNLQQNGLAPHEASKFMRRGIYNYLIFLIHFFLPISERHD